METIDIKIAGMTCQHCTNFVKMTVEELEGVENCEVSLDEAKAHVQFDAQKIQAADIVKAVDETHFEVVT